MLRSAAFARLVGPLVLAAVYGAASRPAAAQLSQEFVTGDAIAAWEKWESATLAILGRDRDTVERLFGELLARDPSPLRIALLAERTVMRTGEGGAVLLLEQDAENKALGPNGQRIAELLETGREQLNEADDGWYFAAIGRFDVAHANFRALLESNPDPVALLEFADRVRRRHEILVRLSDDPVMGPSAREFLKLMERGEILVKADPTRIKENIERLAGPPRAFENAVAHLKDSGEYAVPFIVQYLRDPAKSEFTQAILRCLPTIDRPALNPLVVALRMDNHATKRYLIGALGQIPYPQSLPYLLRLIEAAETPTEVRDAATRALDDLRGRGVSIELGLTAAEAFYRLAGGYYEDLASLAADPRLDTANVWYWRDELLQNVEVPTPIFNEVMCLRCCEEALLLDPEKKPALALWLAANFRRVAQLPDDQEDATRPPNFPSPAYFAQSAGAEYCLMTLARGVDDGDPAVALGAIEALHKTAGPASVVGDTVNGRQPLAEALSFPDRMVRIRAGLALGRALPVKPFHNYQNLMPVLTEALMLFGGARNALVVDPDAAVANHIAAGLRAEGYVVLTDAGLLAGLEKVRNELPGIDVFFIAADIQNPELVDGLSRLRGEFRFAATPVVIIRKPAERTLVTELVRADHRLADATPTDDPEVIKTAIARVTRAVGARPITAETGLGLALEAAEVLKLLVVTNNPLFQVADAEPALLAALQSTDRDLRLAVAEILGYLASATAQGAIAGIALNTTQPEELRVRMFAALAEAAKRHGNLLGADPVRRIVAIAEADENMAIRTAASQTLGALNLPGNYATVIVRNQHGG